MTFAEYIASILKERIRKLEAERNAIRRKTIENCAALADDRAETWHNESRRMAARDLRDAIRALVHSESEGKEDRPDD